MAKPFALDLSKFKKAHSDKDSTTLVHKDGHKITVAHRALSPKMRGQLAEMPVALAEGGGIPGGNGSPALDQKKAKANEDDLNKTRSVGDYISNLKDAFTSSPEPKPSPGSPKYADGGEVEQHPSSDTSSQMPEADSPDKIASDAAAQPPAAAPQSPVTINLNTGAQPQQMAPNPIPPTPPMLPPAAPNGGASGSWEPPASAPIVPQHPMATPSTPPDTFGNEAMANAYTKGIDEQKAGLIGEANAEGQLGKNQASLINQQQQSQQQLLQMYKDHTAELDTERKALQDDIAKSHIDPNRYMGSLSTGSKVMNAIGLILGGIGGGLTHQENPALKFIQSQIERDIDAQKSDLGKKQNLLSANMNQFKNMRDATDMTRVMQMDMVSNQLKAAAANAQDPISKARALKAAGDIDMQAAPIMSQISMRRTLLSGANNGIVPPERVVMAIVPKDQQPAAYKELQEAETMSHARDNLLSSFDKLNQLNTVGNRAAHLGFTPPQVAAIRDPLIAGLSKDTAGRFTESDAKMVGALFPSAGDSAETIQTKRSQLQKLITEKMSFPLLQTYGINPSNMGRFNGQGQSRIQESAPLLPKK